MTFHDWLRFAVIVCTAVFAVCGGILVLRWHMTPDGFDLRDLFITIGKDRKQHVSRPAVAELVALAATTSGYLGTLAIRPQDFETCTLVYGGLWVIRGGYSTYLRSKQK